MRLRAKLIEIEADKPIVILNEEDAKDLGVYVSGRVKLIYGEKEIIAIVDTTETLVNEGEIGIFEDVNEILKIKDLDWIEVVPTSRPKSVDFIKKKLDGFTLEEHEIMAIIQDIVNDSLSSIELSAFVTGGYINGYTIDEVVALTRAMVKTGQQIDFGENIVDKHCIGGVAGNRTTLLIVPIIAACGLKIPKTSSRAITSPAGTADTMEVLASVEFTVEELKDIVNEVGGCIVWGGAVNLAPADDKIIRVEYPLALDVEGHLLASVMAKKLSVGSDYVLIDIPVGKGTKVESVEKANSLAKKFIEIGKRVDIKVECIITDGSCPIGNGIGPALEARDALLCLQNRGPLDLTRKAIELAGVLLELAGKAPRGEGKKLAEEVLVSGKAYEKMKEIIAIQDGDPDIKPEDIPIGDKTETIVSDYKGRVGYIDNRGISMIARTAGAPRDKGAGVYLHVTVGDIVNIGDPLFTIYSSSENRLKEAVSLAEECKPIRVGSIITRAIA